MSQLKESDFKSLIAFGLARQFQGMWRMVRQAIDQIPDEHWAQGIKEDKKWFYSLRVYHIIETAEFYARDTHEGMLWGARLGKVNWWETITHKEAAAKVVKGETRIYQTDIAKYIESYLKRISDEELLKKDGFHWFSSVLEKLQYLLQHNLYHLGELTMQLRALRCDRITWS